MMNRSFYSAEICNFLKEPTDKILAAMVINNPFDLNDLQRDSWITEIELLKQQLKNVSSGRVLFEYTIPRMGKRVDVVLLVSGIVFLFEFKAKFKPGEKKIRSSALNQVLDYALDLKNFQKESHSRIIVPIAVSTDSETQPIKLEQYNDNVFHPIGISSEQILYIVQLICDKYHAEPIDGIVWENSEYMPTPTIIEAAQALYNNHNVKDITRNDAEDLSDTTETIKTIIKESKDKNQKSIVFVTGVPGAGKTLVGLNLASQLHNSQADEHAVFLSGNHPLVSVLQEALARDKISREQSLGNKVNKKDARREIVSFIQMIYNYRNDHFGNDVVPRERIAIFDESQRAWTHDEMVSFMRKNNKLKPGELYIRDAAYSEPGFLISTMNRHKDWAVIICLVGGGQEINRGEAGMPEWFDSLRKHFPNWHVYTTKQINDNEYLRDRSWQELISGLHIHFNNHLHLSASMRSFRSERVAEFVHRLLDNNAVEAKRLLSEFHDKYHVRITRDLNAAKNWVRSEARGNERYGLFASSKAVRLKPRGVFYVRNDKYISPENWFLNGQEDIQSSYFLEAVASEFETQGLELDFAIVAWDADLRIENGEWKHYQLSTRKTPPDWSPIKSKDNIIYLTNAYRVLLTRARQGFIIYIPEGVNDDETRKPEIYDETYQYLKSLGIEEI